MTLDRAIQLLQIEKEYTLKQRGFQQQAINKEVAEALDIAIEAVKSKVDIVRCKDCKYYTEDTELSPDFVAYYCSMHNNAYSFGDYDFCSDGERKAE